MDITKEFLQDRMEELQAKERELSGQVASIRGALYFCEMLIATIDNPDVRVNEADFVPEEGENANG